MQALDSMSMPSFDYQGGWEDDEEIHDAACREAIEEAGVKGILSVSFFSVLGTGVTAITLMYNSKFATNKKKLLSLYCISWTFNF
jgi:8-oxo-dGTP pyrophosphatase MutT (NUDIX family)